MMPLFSQGPPPPPRPVQICSLGTSSLPWTCSNLFTWTPTSQPVGKLAVGLPTEFAFSSAFFKLRRICGDTVCVRHKNCIARMIGHAQHQHWETTFSRLLAAVRNSIFYTFLYLNLKRVISLYHPPVQRRVSNVFNRVCLSVYLSTGKVLM